MKNRRMNTRNLVIVVMILSLVIGLAVDYVNAYAESIKKIDCASDFNADDITYKCKQHSNAKINFNLQKGKPWLNTELVTVSPRGKDAKATIELMKTDTKVKKGKKREKVTWKSSNPKVAKIVKTGGKNKETVTIKGLKKGKCKITATYKKNKYECYVIVTNETMLSSYYVHGGKNYTMKVKIINAVPGHTYVWFREDKGCTTWTGLSEQKVWDKIFKLNYSKFEKAENIKAAQELLNEPCAVGTSANIKIVSGNNQNTEYIYIVDATEGYTNRVKSIQWNIDNKFDENGNEVDLYSNDLPAGSYAEELRKPWKKTIRFTHMLRIEPYGNTKGKPKKRTGYYPVDTRIAEYLGTNKWHESLYEHTEEDEEGYTDVEPDYDEEYENSSR